MTDELLQRFRGDHSLIESKFARLTLEQIIANLPELEMGRSEFLRYGTALRSAFIDNPLISRKPLSKPHQLATLPNNELRNYNRVIGPKSTIFLNQALLKSIGEA